AAEVDAPSFFTVKPPRSLPPATWADPVTFGSDPDLAASAPPATARTSEARTAMARTRRRIGAQPIGRLRVYATAQRAGGRLAGTFLRPGSGSSRLAGTAPGACASITSVRCCLRGSLPRRLRKAFESVR